MCILHINVNISACYVCIYWQVQTKLTMTKDIGKYMTRIFMYWWMMCILYISTHTYIYLPLFVYTYVWTDMGTYIPTWTHKCIYVLLYKYLNRCKQRGPWWRTWANTSPICKSSSKPSATTQVLQRSATKKLVNSNTPAAAECPVQSHRHCNTHCNQLPNNTPRSVEGAITTILQLNAWHCSIHVIKHCNTCSWCFSAIAVGLQHTCIHLHICRRCLGLHVFSYSLANLIDSQVSWLDVCTCVCMSWTGIFLPNGKYEELHMELKRLVGSSNL